MGDQEFDSLAKELFDTVMERHPVVATYLGLHQYDHLMPENTRQSILEEIALIKNFRPRFESQEPEELSGSRALDRELVLYLIDLNLYSLEELRWWERLPDGAEGIGESLFPLFTREFAPLEKRVESMTARLEAAPAYLDGLRSRLVRPVRLWTEMAIEASERLPAFLSVISGAVEGRVPQDTYKDLKKAIGEATQALEDYESWLRGEILPGAAEEHIVREERLRRLMELRRLGITLEEVRELGERYLREAKEELKELAKTIDPDATVEEVADRIKSNHPTTFEDVLEEVRQTIEEAREFVKQHRLATLPPAEKLLVVETPTFLRPILPFAAYFPPAKFDKVQQGVYIVTPPSDGEERLKEHNYASIRNTAVHEGYPGHHLQLSAANLNPSLIRQLTFGVSAAETVEGWAHYCEDLMREAGFSASPEVRFVQLQDIIWRACRILIDVDLHCGRMTFDEAVEMLVRETGMERPSAIAEVKRYTQSPTYQLSYLLGKHLLMELRGEVQRRLGERYSHALFHDTILYSGSLPFFLLRKSIEDKLAKLEEGVEDLY